MKRDQYCLLDIAQGGTSKKPRLFEHNDTISGDPPRKLVSNGVKPRAVGLQIRTWDDLRFTCQIEPP